VLGLAIILVRRHVPESPRWLFIHGRDREAEQLVADIEQKVERETGQTLAPAEGTIGINQRRSTGFGEIASTLFRRYPRRAVLGLALFIGQAFLYNAITFGYAQILQTFFDVPSGSTGYYFAAIALGNLFGPLLLGHLFDTLGRRTMIAGTYVLSGVLLFATAALFGAGMLSAVTMTLCWCVVLFFASAGASSAYLTVSEVFPLEARAMAIAFFYAIGTAAGGIVGPLLFAKLVGSGEVSQTVIAFCVGAALMAVAGIVAWFLAVDAERRSLEDLARPLSAAEDA
jgi:MFS family permease